MTKAVNITRSTVFRDFAQMLKYSIFQGPMIFLKFVSFQQKNEVKYLFSFFSFLKKSFHYEHFHLGDI
jgi:hypothetical protein